ncbi:MAG: Rap1a/Tai family immunity protein [Pseudomonadota bacterium]
MRAFLIGVMMVWGLPVAAERERVPLSVKEALRMRASAGAPGFANRADWMALTYYLQGVIEGAVVHARMPGAAGSFCPVPNAHYDLGSVFVALEGVDPSQQDEPVAKYVLEVLAQRYPCAD